MIQVFDVDLFDGHLILLMNGQKILVDTGSPVTISRNNQLDFMGQQYGCVTNLLGRDITAISNLMGYDIDVLMGMDVLRNYFIITDYHHEKALFSDEPINISNEPLCSTSIIPGMVGHVCIEMTVKDRLLRFALDTGAKISYIEEALVEEETVVEIRDDFAPLIGGFQTPIYALEATIGNQSFPVEFGVLPPAYANLLQQLGISGVIGSDLFRAFTTIMDFRNNVLTISKPNE